MTGHDDEGKRPLGTYVVVYGPGFVVEDATPGIQGFFEAWPGLLKPGEGDVPSRATELVRTLVAQGERVALLEPALAVRVETLSGDGGTRVVATFEHFSIRDPLRTAADRFALTDREVQVLELVLLGMRAADIARVLEISELTVGDYFKHLREKTGARTQSGMLARLLSLDRSNELSDGEDAS